MQTTKEKVLAELLTVFHKEDVKEYSYGYKINVKAIHGHHIDSLNACGDTNGILYSDVTIKRSGNGIVILIKVR